MSDTTAAGSMDKLETSEDFVALLEESLGTQEGLEGSVVKGTIVAIEHDAAVVDVGLKAEGRIALKEFAAPGQAPEIKLGDVVEVFLERIENKQGEAHVAPDFCLEFEFFFYPGAYGVHLFL